MAPCINLPIGRMKGRKEGRKEGRNEGRKEGRSWRACLRSAGAGGRDPAPAARANGALPAGPGAGAGGEADWLEEAVEGLLRQAASGAGVEL